MIEEAPDGTILLSFDDWSEAMEDLSQMLVVLPKKPKQHDRAHDLGIDRLAKMTDGVLMIQLLIDHADQLDQCPDDKELVKLGRALFKANLNLSQVQARRLRHTGMRRTTPTPPSPRQAAYLRQLAQKAALEIEQERANKLIVNEMKAKSLRLLGDSDTRTLLPELIRRYGIDRVRWALNLCEQYRPQKVRKWLLYRLELPDRPRRPSGRKRIMK